MGRKPTTVRYFRKVRRTAGLNSFYRTEPDCLCVSICIGLPTAKWNTSSRRAAEIDAHVNAGLLVEISEEDCIVRYNPTGSINPQHKGYPTSSFRDRDSLNGT